MLNTIKIYIGSDHRAYDNKNKLFLKLKEIGYNITDLGPYIYNPTDDYTDIAIKVSKAIALEKRGSAVGILICSSGLGMYMTSNKIKGIIAGESYTTKDAIIDRKHHGSNILVLNENSSANTDSALELIVNWINTPFETNTRHERRIKQIEALECLYLKPITKVSVIPAVLEYDINKYILAIEKLSSISNLLHLDIMDGRFVETLSPDLRDILTFIKNYKINVNNRLMFSIHLMTRNPLEQLRLIAGSNHSSIHLVYVHAEMFSIDQIKKSLLSEEYPFQLGLVFNPDTNIEEYAEILPYLSVLQLMTVYPGKQGGDFQEKSLSKINFLHDPRNKFTGFIHLDGAINLQTSHIVKKYNVDLVGVGSAISKSKNPRRELEKIQRILG